MIEPSPAAEKIKLPIFTFQSLLGRVRSIYQAQLVNILIPTALLMIPVNLINMWSADQMLKSMDAVGFSPYDQASIRVLSPEQLTALLNSIISPLLIFLVIALVLSFVQELLIGGLVVYLTSESYFGRRATLGEAIGALGKRLMTIAGALLLYELIIAGIVIALSFVFFACGLGFGLVLYIIITLQSLIIPVILLERTSIFIGLNRSWHLAKRRFWMLAGVCILVAALNFVLSNVVGAIREPTVAVIIQIVISILIAPIAYIANTLVYYDSRVRFEDLESALNLTGRISPRPSDVPSLRPISGLMENSDFVNLAIITAGVFALALALLAINFVTSGSRLMPGG